jgi:hypothetical protein
MIGNIITTTLFFLLIFYILFRFYNQFIYPILQFFKKKNEHGYVLVGNSHYEHRAKVEKLIGRKLLPDEEVHHINGKKWDNRKSNLALMTRENHQKWHQRLSWMYENKMFPSISTQRKKLIEEFSARLF